MVSLLSLDYLAGLVDGEGCIQIRRTARPRGRSPQHQLALRIALVYKPTIDALGAQFGGSVHTYKRRFPRRESHVWIITGTAAADVLTRLYPLLREKQEQAWLALEFQAQCTTHNKVTPTAEEFALRDGFYWAMRQAKTYEFVTA